MNFLDTPLINGLESLLSVATTRQGLIAGNLANVDTPGYQTRDLDFAQALAEAEAGQDPASAAQNVTGLVARPDGNNVSIDREQVLMAQTQLQFAAGAALLHEEFQRISQAINSGSGGGES